MFDWSLFLFLIVLCLPGILLVVPSSLKMVRDTMGEPAQNARALPSHRVMIIAGILQSVALVSLASAVGTALAPRVGLGAPWLTALLHGHLIRPELQGQLLPLLGLSMGGTAIFLLAYYGLFRPRLDNKTVAVMEELRMRMGLSGRLLYGGIVEEVLMRWGLMTLLVWLGVLVVGAATGVVMWGAILIAGILFGLGHLPSYLAAGCRKSPAFITATLVLNLWAALIFGWLYWQIGLVAAILSHMLFHLFWWPFERASSRRRPAVEGAIHERGKLIQ